jgi:uncharacterized protein involved in oxidation of intracellular sulfur
MKNRGISNMKLLIILNRNPYDGSDVTRNALRLADFALEALDNVSIFLMNDAVDLSREGVSQGGYDTNLGVMLRDLISKGVPVKVCSTCLMRCGSGREKPLIGGAIEAKMPELVSLIKEANKVISF